MKKLFLLLCILSLTISCKREIKHYQKIHASKTHVKADNGNDAFLFWYVIYSNNGSYYTYSSPTPVSDFSSVSWTQTTTNPTLDVPVGSIEDLPEVVVAEQSLSPEMQDQIDSTPENFEGMTQEEMGDYEGGGTESDGSVSSGENNSNESSTSTESSSSESSSDGGDAGGDGGGGGGE